MSEEQGYPTAARAYAALAILVLVTFSALLDRYLIALLLQPIRAEMSITDTQASLLQGLAFALFYSLLGIPFGRLVDRGNRRNIIIVGVFLWSLMTVLCGLAETYTQLFLARLGVGFGEACLAPAAYSLLTDLFTPRRHGRALATFTFGSVAGGGGSFIVGAAALSLAGQMVVELPGYGVLAPWRLTFVLIGAPGILVALLMLLIREPQRHGVGATEAAPTWGELWAFVRSIRKPFMLLTAGHCAATVAGTGITGWLAVFLARTYGVPTHEGGHWIGWVLISSGLLGSIVAGSFADSRLISRLKGQRLIVSAAAAIATLPFILSFPLATTATLAVVGYFAYSLMYNIHVCCAPTVLQDILPNRFKGQVSAIYWLCVGVVGFGGGSTAVALITDKVFGADEMVRYSLMAVGAPAMIIAFLCYMACRPSYQKVRDGLVKTQA